MDSELEKGEKEDSNLRNGKLRHKKYIFTKTCGKRRSRIQRDDRLQEIEHPPIVFIGSV